MLVTSVPGSAPARVGRGLAFLVTAAVLAGAVLVGVGTAGAAAPAAAVEPPTAPTSSGLLQGNSDGVVDTFAGVRYAAAPVGALRFAPTRPAATRSDAVAATRAGPRCPQAASSTAAVESEDCLFLNVTRPAAPSTTPRPVIVWWHGGGFVGGEGAYYAPRRMVTRGDVVVVTVNYRLGDLGYLALPGVAGGGTFGFGDQLESLRWVRRNIAAFGGDAANVTLAGESAGAFSICAALTSPAAAGLFDKAIMSSGSCAVVWAAGAFGRGTPRQTPYRSRAAAEQAAVNRAAALGCSGSSRLSCLRSKPVSSFRSPPGPIYSPAYGTTLIPENPVQALRNGRMNAVPILSGSNHDELRTGIGRSHLAKPYTSAEYASILRADFGTNANRVAATYPSYRFSSPGMAWATAATDGSWACPTLAGNELTSAIAPTYAYEFDDRSAPSSAPASFPFGAYHAADLFYLFDLPTGLSGAQLELGNTLIAYWTTFARTGDPNGADLAPVPLFDERRTVTRMAPGEGGIAPTDFAGDHRCGLWNTIPF